MADDRTASNSRFGKGCDKFGEVSLPAIGDGLGKYMLVRSQVVALRTNLNGIVRVRSATSRSDISSEYVLLFFAASMEEIECDRSSVQGS